MAKTTKNILTLNHEEVMDFFMRSEQYHGFELPEYFTFDKVLNYVRETIGDAPYEACLQERITPDQLSDVNLDILLNKDGRYAVRPIVLANPYLYYCCSVQQTGNAGRAALACRDARKQPPRDGGHPPAPVP